MEDNSELLVWDSTFCPFRRFVFWHFVPKPNRVPVVQGLGTKCRKTSKGTKRWKVEFIISGRELFLQKNFVSSRFYSFHLTYCPADVLSFRRSLFRSFVTQPWLEIFRANPDEMIRFEGKRKTTTGTHYFPPSADLEVFTVPSRLAISALWPFSSWRND